MKLKTSVNQGPKQLLMISSLLFLFLIVRSSDDQGPIIDERINKLSPLAKELLTKRIAELTHNKMIDCKEKAIKAAEIQVDSLIIREATMTRAGIYGIPIKPLRPDVPNVILKADSIDIGPLFENDSLNN